MALRLLDRIALAIALLVAACGLAAFGIGTDAGIRLLATTEGLVVAGVDQGGPAEQAGIREGMTVVDLNGTPLWTLPSLDVPEDAPRPSGPAETPSPAITDLERLEQLSTEPVVYVGALYPEDLLEGGRNAGWNALWMEAAPWAMDAAAVAFVLGVVILAGGCWLLLTGRAGTSLRELAVPLALAVAAPFLLEPLAIHWYPAAEAVHGLALAIAMLPLAFGLLERVEGELDRRIGLVLFGGIATLTAAAAVVPAMTGTGLYDVPPIWSALVGMIPLFPGLLAAGPIDADRVRGAASSTGRLVRSAEYALAGATPFFALLSPGNAPWFLPLSLWLVALALAGRFTVRPLARLATRAQLQRDLVVAATEAERARVAADIHDDALQELTLLVRRLDAAGDVEGADIARTVSDRLRAICGDLRLPILDDLGVGPALDWLVLRIERLAGGEVRLERNDGTRPPPEVELAFFRVAQEALSNAVKHGSAPITVRYQATPAGVSLSVDDAGPGIEPGAGAAAEGGAHLGLLNMQQRAEQIGAILDIRRWPGGGTHVALEWRPR